MKDLMYTEAFQVKQLTVVLQKYGFIQLRGKDETCLVNMDQW